MFYHSNLPASTIRVRIKPDPSFIEFYHHTRIQKYIDREHNIFKYCSMLFIYQSKHYDITHVPLIEKLSTKFLGVTIDAILNWQ